MDREAVSRARRRQEALDAAQFEQEREGLLRDQLVEQIGFLEGWRTDEAVLNQLAPADAEALRAMSFAAEQPDDEERASLEEEIARLEQVLAECVERQQVLARYLEALGE